MGGSASMEWLGALGASFDAALGRAEEEAAADLAFSLRQDVSVAEALTRSGTSWLVVVEGEASVPVDEVGADYARAGVTLLPAGRLSVRSVPGSPPRRSDASLSEILGRACRAGAVAEVVTPAARHRGTLVRAAADHLALQLGGTQVVVGLEAIERVRFLDGGGYSASRGFSGSC